ncbi:MAG: signal peptidase II [Lachnospiraceae bacterium]|nr:signal peptidase II [Lachnospiraceae bacterium]
MKKSSAFIILSLVCAAFLIAADRVTKSAAVQYLKDREPIVLLKGVLELKYLENHGAAFGVLQNKQTLFFILTIIVLGLLFYFFLFRIPQGAKYLPLNILCILLFSGAIGNFIDRITQSYVVDFIYFSLIDFPIFNVADCYVSVSAVLLFVLLLFCYKEEDLKGIL